MSKINSFSVKSNINRCSAVGSSLNPPACSGLVISTPFFQMSPQTALKFCKTKSLSTSMQRQLSTVNSYNYLTQLITNSSGMPASGSHLAELIGENEGIANLKTITGKFFLLDKLKPDLLDAINLSEALVGSTNLTSTCLRKAGIEQVKLSCRKQELKQAVQQPTGRVF